MDREVFEQHKKLEMQHWWFQSRFAVIHFLLDLIVQKKSSLLDIGCGTGGMTALLSKKHHCVGVDTSATAIGIAKELYPDNQFIQGDAHLVLENFDRTVDVVLLLDVLEHINDDKAFLSSISNRIAPDTHIIITVPAKQALWSKHDVTAGHFRRYERDTLTALWQDDPSISVKMLSFYNARLYAIIKLIRFFSIKINLTIGNSGTDFFKTPKVINNLLRKIFSGEKTKLARLLNKKDGELPYKNGVSMIAILKKNKIDE